MRLLIEGMTCKHCKMRVEKALDSIEGVRSSRVDLDSNSATLEVSGEIDRKVIREAIEAAGYSLKSIED